MQRGKYAKPEKWSKPHRPSQWRLCCGSGMCGSLLFIDGVSDRGNWMHCEVYKAIAWSERSSQCTPIMRSILHIARQRWPTHFQQIVLCSYWRENWRQRSQKVTTVGGDGLADPLEGGNTAFGDVMNSCRGTATDCKGKNLCLTVWLFLSL